MTARRSLALFTTVALVVAQAAAIVLVAVVAGPAPSASAVPGQPGTPSAGVPLFAENFEASGDGTNTLITAYTGASGEHYTADPGWANYANCNGFVIDQSSVVVAGECQGNPATQTSVRSLASLLGQFQGLPAGNSNATVSSFTQVTVPPGVVLKTIEPIALASAGRFLTFSTQVVVQGCVADGGPGDPAYNYYLLNGATKVPISTAPLDPCRNPLFATGTRIGTVTAPQPILWTGSTVGLEFDNTVGQAAGNDAAFDNIQLTDVSPQLDKSFSPATIAVGQVSRLTFTVTNSSDLFAKPGWSFSDALPSGVVVAPTPGASTTCTGATLTATAGTGSIGVTNGSLIAGQTSCTVAVNVTAPASGSFTNGAPNITSSGLLPPGNATLAVVDTDFGDAPASYGTATASNTLTPGLTLGATRDSEVTAAASADASGDDTTGSDDEDALTGTITRRVDQPVNVTVPVANTTGAPATLAGWVDFTRDGDFADAGEQATVAVPAGATSVTLSWPTPPGATAGASFIRLRLMPGTVAAPSPTAAIAGGEIEDHPIQLTIPSISLVKHAGVVQDAAAPTGVSAGDTIAYTFDVTNTGNAPLDPVVVSDPLLTGISCPAGALAAGATVTCTATPHALTQAEVDGGTVHNTATVRGTPQTGPAVTATSFADSNFTAVPAVSLQKSAAPIVDANADGRVDAGDTITYGFVATNSGAVTLSPVTVSDPKVGAVTCSAGALAPRASITCTPVTYRLTLADVDAGAVNNTATATGTTPSGGAVTGQSSTATPVTSDPELQLVKSAAPVVDADGDGRQDVGDTIAYSFRVTNVGTVTLDPVTIADPRLAGVTCPNGPLAAGASFDCTAPVYSLTQADLDAGFVANTATATGTPPRGTSVTATGATRTPLVGVAALALTKTAGPVVDANGSGRVDAGDTIAFDLRVANTGNVTLDPVTVSDPRLGAVTCPAGALAPAATVDCAAAVYTLAQADVDADTVHNLATATGSDPAGGAVTGDATADRDFAATASLALAKRVSAVNDNDVDGLTGSGDTIVWSFTLTNTGAVTLHGPVVSDPVAGAVTCPAGDLAPGASVTCTADAAYAITQADVDAGAVNNTATAAATDPRAATVDSAPSSTSTRVDRRSALALELSAQLVDADGDGRADPGEHVKYAFDVTNTGTTTLGSVTISDPMLVAAHVAITCPAGPVAPGATVTCTADDYTVTAADVAAGSLRTLAQAGAVGPDGAVASDPAEASLPTAARPRLAFTGTDVSIALGAMSALLVAGLALVVVQRRRRRS